MVPLDTVVATHRLSVVRFHVSICSSLVAVSNGKFEAISYCIFEMVGLP